MKNSQRTIGQLSKEADVPARTIRFYEQAGLMPPAERLESGYRIYSIAELRRLRLIKQARALGLTIPETRNLIDRAFDMECGEYRDELFSIIEQRLADVERRIFELRLFRKDLRSLLQHVGHIDGSTGSRVADCAFCPLIDDSPDVRVATRKANKERRPKDGLPVP